jgi:uncharacterized protein (TIGR04141 family)
MGKLRPFSIYLLKHGYHSANSLKADHSLAVVTTATALPENSVLYILDADPKPPWWKSYFGVQLELWQQYKGALLFLPVGNRCFALSFGQVFHHLNDSAYEYDFGLRVTLNSLDPNELKSADMVAPGVARRKRTQVPVSTELTYLDFDGNSEIIKSLTGKVKPEYQEIFKNATGSSALKVSLALEPSELAETCEKLLTLYAKDDYKLTFPNIQNIVPVRDPTKIADLDDLLLESLRTRDGRTTLTIPDIVDYRDNTCCVFSGDGKTSQIYPDISIEQFFEFLGPDFDFETLTLDGLKGYRITLTDVDGRPTQSYGLYRALLFEAELENEDVIYHLCEGVWYRIEKSFIERLKNYLDPKCEDTDLCPYNHDSRDNDGRAVYSEGNYNTAIPVWRNEFICLDRTDISPAGSTGIEPCDIYTVCPDAITGHRGVFYHLKISTRSTHLSHLFNQRVNSVELIKLEDTSRQKMKRLLVDRLNGNDQDVYLAPLETFQFKVVFGVITHKDTASKSENLPLFSKISLMRSMQRLDLMEVPSVLTFISDQSPKKDGHQKYVSIIVEVLLGTSGKVEVRAVAGQGFDSTQAIKRCPREVSEAVGGTRFNLSLKRSGDGTLASFHSWPFDRIA